MRALKFKIFPIFFKFRPKAIVTQGKERVKLLADYFEF